METADKFAMSEMMISAGVRERDPSRAERISAKRVKEKLKEI